MARRYSPADQAKMARDTMADFRAKGIDVRQIAPLRPGGLPETLKAMKKELNAVRDQSQEQTAQNLERHQKNVRTSKERNKQEAERVLKNNKK